MIRITKEVIFGERRWGFELLDEDGRRVSRQLPCWERRRDAVESAEFHRKLHGMPAPTRKKRQSIA